jgi:hypothetical protein
MLYEEIQAAIAKQINYAELASLLELDLQSIADEVVTEAEDYIEFKVFFDSGEFETAIEAQNLGAGPGLQKTPILLSFINGDYSTSRGPQFFSTVFAIEVFGFENDRELLRKIFESYSYLNQGKVDSEDLGIYTTTTLEFPTFTAPFQHKGSTRTQGFMRLFMNYMYTGQMSNDVGITIDTNEFKPQLFKITKQRTAESSQEGGQSEVTNIYNSEVTTISGSVLYDGSDAAIALFEGIVELNANINKEYTIITQYNNIGTTPFIMEYDVRLDNGEALLSEGGVMQLTYSFVLSDPGLVVSPQVV